MLKIVPLAFAIAAALASVATLASATPASEHSQAAPDVSYGMKVVEAARAQVSALVIYNPAYQKIPYPNGDIPSYQGVCTDVVVRTYRAFGVDLQQLVHEARAGSGDTNIDHRRVEVLRKFFKRKGQSLKVTQDPGNYLPGDIVTQHLPDGLFSKTHIAIVSDRKTSDGVPLIIHNRGFGVAEEDWLFAKKITGHYRYQPEMKAKVVAK